MVLKPKAHTILSPLEILHWSLVFTKKTELYSSVQGAVSSDVDTWRDTEMNVLNWVGFVTLFLLDSLSECALERQYVYQPGPCDCYIVPPGKRDHQMSMWAFQHFITGLLMLCAAHRHRAPIPLPSVWQCTFYLTVKKCFRDSTRSTFVFKCITALRRCQYRLVPVDVFVFDDPRTPDLCSLWCCDVAACHMHAVIQVLFCFFCGWGGTHLSKCYICEGKKNASVILFVIYFYIFVFCKWSLNICISKKWQVQENVYKQLCSDYLFSFLHGEVIFSEK